MDKNKLHNAYTGEQAHNYNNKRTGNRKWRLEQEAMQTLLQTIPNQTTLLDVPAGTGRFFPFYSEKKLTVCAMDISDDMLREARLKARETEIENIEFNTGDIFNIPKNDSAFHTVLCVRFLNWVKWADVEKAFSELTRVSENYIVIGMRHYLPWRNILTPVPKFHIIRKRLLQYIQQYRAPKGLVFHRESNIYKLFQKNDLTIQQKVCIEKRGDGTHYYFYLLQQNKTKEEKCL